MEPTKELLEFHDQLREKMYFQAKKSIDKNQARYKKTYDRRCNKSVVNVTFRVDDLVQYVNYRKLELKGAKLESNWLPANGACRVVEVVGTFRLVIHDPEKEKLKKIPQCYARVVGHLSRVSKSVFLASEPNVGLDSTG